MFFSRPFPAFVVFRFLFDDGHVDWCVVMPHCSFIWTSLVICHVGHLFMCFMANCLLWRDVYLCLPHIFRSVFLFFGYWALLSACVCLTLILCPLQIFSPIFFSLWSPITLQSCVSFCTKAAWIICKYAYIPYLLSLPPTLTIPPFLIFTDHRA